MHPAHQSETKVRYVCATSVAGCAGAGSGGGCCMALGNIVELLWDFGCLCYFREIDVGEFVLCL